MRTVRMPQTDWPISSIGFGAWAIADPRTWGDQDEGAALAAVQASVDEGVNFFDTAPMYGDGLSERLLGRALKDVRNRVLIASKVPPAATSAARVRAACEQSLKNLETDRIDLYQVHWPNRRAPVAETLGALDALQAEGKIRAYGVCNFGTRDLGPALKPKRFAVVSNQLAYNLLFRAIEFEILPFCARQRVGVFCYSPLAMGLLTGKFASADAVPPGRARTRHFAGERPEARHGEAGAEAETFEAIQRIDRICRELGEPMSHVALSWLLAQRGVTAVVVGARSAYQARRNARAGNLVLPHGVADALAAATEPLKRRLGPNADLWQSEAESRIR